MNAKTENARMRQIMLNHYNRITDERTVYTALEITDDCKVILTGTFENFYLVRDCYNGDNQLWSDWTGTVDGGAPVGEQHK